MPYQKRYAPRRQRYNKSRKYSSANSKANYAIRLAKKAQVQKELKHNAISNSAAISTTGANYELSTITQGDTNNTRDGNVIYPTSAKVRMQMTQHASATQTFIRVIVYKWISESPSGITDYLESAAIDSFKSEQNRYQSVTLFDKTYVLTNISTSAMFREFKVKLGGMIAYPEATGVANRNSIYMAVLSSEATNTPTVDWQSRLYFKDA